LLKVIPATIYSVVTISHKINIMTSYGPEERKDGSLPPSPIMGNTRLTLWGCYPLDK
jgi:hypothetical protein